MHYSVSKVTFQVWRSPLFTFDWSVGSFNVHHIPAEHTNHDAYVNIVYMHSV